MGCSLYSDSDFNSDLNTNLVLEMRKYQKETLHIRKTQSKEKIMSLPVQLFVITFTNLACWLPTSGVYIAALSLEQYPIDMVIWTSVCVMPINSLINPIIFVFPSIHVRCEFRPHVV